MPDVVLVDDDEHYREVLSADLADWGFSVSCFADGPSLLEALSNGIEAKVALLDLALPKMSGFELLDALRARGIGLPVVFLTGYSQVKREMQALDRGAIDFVDKARGHRGAGPPLARDPLGAAPDLSHGDARSRALRRAGFVPFDGARPMATAGCRFDRHRIQDRDAAGIGQGHPILPHHL
jgi:CheY-like chemotaxis protein